MRDKMLLDGDQNLSDCTNPILIMKLDNGMTLNLRLVPFHCCEGHNLVKLISLQPQSTGRQAKTACSLCFFPINWRNYFPVSVCILVCWQMCCTFREHQQVMIQFGKWETYWLAKESFQKLPVTMCFTWSCVAKSWHESWLGAWRLL